MPTLHWVGKDKVVNHHHDVPFRVLNKVSTFTAPAGTPANTTDNRIIHGDNLEALKSLLPEFEGRVKCIYIDPPYNTGNEGWVYNDAVNDPKMKRWLGQVVGKEGEDLSRHDKWLCMMYPRLKLLYRLLASDGAIFISIDDIEHANLRLICDENFGAQNLLANFVWQSKDTPGNNSVGVAETHNHVVAYRKTPGFSPNLQDRNQAQIDTYTNQDGDPRGPWLGSTLTRAEHRDRDYYPIRNPAGVDILPPPGSSWRRPPAEMKRLAEEDRIWWGKDGGAAFPKEKKFLSEVKAGVVNQTWWPYSFAGSTRNASAELKAIFDGRKLFETPKPVRLIEQILLLASDKNSLVLDSFAGSGTTAHAVLKANSQDSGNRQFILVETEDYADSITAERVRRAMTGFGEGSKAALGLGGGFDYYTVGEPMFLPNDNLNEAVGTEAIRGYVAYSEGIPAEDRATPDNPHSPYLLGLNRETAWLFHYEPDRATSLDMDFLAGLRFGSEAGAARPGTFIIYADRCLLSQEFMRRHGIVFKKIPRDITRF
jgi:adenine-specific DNA-methyltransferase